MNKNKRKLTGNQIIDIILLVANAIAVIFCLFILLLLDGEINEIIRSGFLTMYFLILLIFQIITLNFEYRKIEK